MPRPFSKRLWPSSRKMPRRCWGWRWWGCGEVRTGRGEDGRAALRSIRSCWRLAKLLARLALEDNDTRRTVEQVEKALAISSGRFRAPVGAGRDGVAGRPRRPGVDRRVLERNPRYGKLYETIGHFFVLTAATRRVSRIPQGRGAGPGAVSARSQLGRQPDAAGPGSGRAAGTGSLLPERPQGSRHGEYAAAARQLQEFRGGEVGPHHSRAGQERGGAAAAVFRGGAAAGAIAVYEKKYGFQAGTAVQLECIPTRGFRGAHAGMPGWARWG